MYYVTFAKQPDWTAQHSGGRNENGIGRSPDQFFLRSEKWSTNETTHTEHTYANAHTLKYVHVHTHTGTSAMSRSVTLVKGKNNMIGISIGGGAPLCPVLYVVQVSSIMATLGVLQPRYGAKHLS